MTRRGQKKKKKSFHTQTINEKRGHRFEGEHGTVYCWTRREERE